MLSGHLPHAGLGLGALALLALGGGCSSSSDEGCRPVDLSASPASVARGAPSFSLRTRMTQDGKPVAGAQVEFALTTSDGTQTRQGEAETDADGRATLRVRGGYAAIGLLPGQELAGYTVRGDPASNGDLCQGRGAADVEVTG